MNINKILKIKAYWHRLHATCSLLPATCYLLFTTCSLLLSTCLSSCTADSIIDSSSNNETKNDISEMRFSVSQKNMTRGTTALSGTHYDFGVCATAYTNSTTSIVMPNYLVGDANTATSPYIGYTDFSKGSTQGWTYQALGNANGDKPQTITTAAGSYTKSELAKQELQYWALSKNNYKFLAYTPYLPSTLNQQESSLANQAYMSFDEENNKMIFNHIHAFYTDPAKQTQYAVVTGQMTDRGYNKMADISNSNEDLILSNEANYAGTTIEKVNFGQEVPFSFHHLNSKIHVKFYSDLTGYYIKLMDLIPENTPGPGTGYLPATPGIVFSPATQAQSETPMDAEHNQPALRDLPSYNSYATIPITFNGTTGAIGQFTAGDGEVGNIVGNNHGTIHFKPTVNLLPNNQATAEQSATVYYAIPNWDGTNYITQDKQTGEGKVADNTGYTVHVSYEMVPKEGSSGKAHTKVFDARVWLSQDYCKWKPGYSYTYIFNIKGGNGITNTKTTDPANSNEPWVDSTDPRVPTTSSQMMPIIFYGVHVADYDGGGEEAHYLIEPTEESWGGNFTYNTQIYYYTISPIGNTYFNGYNMVEPSYVAEGVTRASFIKNGENYTTWTFDKTKKRFVYTYDVESQFSMEFNGIVDPNHTDNYYAYIWTTFGVAMKLYATKNGENYDITVTDAKRNSTWEQEESALWDGNAYGIFIPSANRIPALLDMDFASNNGYYYSNRYYYTSYPAIGNLSKVDINDCTFNYTGELFAVMISGATMYFTNNGTSDAPALYLWSKDDKLYRIDYHSDGTDYEHKYIITQENSRVDGNVIYKN